MIFSNIHGKLEALTQTMNWNQDKLGRVEIRLENFNKREEKHGALTPYRNDWYLTSIQLDVPTFNGRLDYFGHSDSQFFLDLLQSIDMYFIWYLFSEAEKIRFATIKLTRETSQYWTSVETSRKKLISTANSNLICYERQTQG